MEVLRILIEEEDLFGLLVAEPDCESFVIGDVDH